MYLKYLKYIIRHKWFVFIECFKIGWKQKKLNMFWRGIMHDISKFYPSEFIPYARYFYGDYPSIYDVQPGYKYEYCGLYKHDVERQFDQARLYHIHRNPHHWQYWLLQEDDGPLKRIPMPTKYLREMVADWRGAGKVITGKDNLTKWYVQNNVIG